MKSLRKRLLVRDCKICQQSSAGETKLQLYYVYVLYIMLWQGITNHTHLQGKINASN